MTRFILALITAIITLYVLIAHLYSLSSPPHIGTGSDWLVFSGAAILFGGALSMIGLHFSEIRDPMLIHESETRRPVLLGFLTSIALIMLYSLYFVHLSGRSSPPSSIETPLLAANTDSRASWAHEQEDGWRDEQGDGWISDERKPPDLDTQSQTEDEVRSPIVGGGVSGETRSSPAVIPQKMPAKPTRPTAKITHTQQQTVTLVSPDFPIPAPGERLFVRFE